MDLYNFDFSSSVRDYDFTKKAIININHIMDSEQFREMDADAIFDYLKNEMEIVSFRDYLKRYIYEQAEIEEPFRQVTDDVYVDIIMSSFEEHDCPHAFTPTKKRWSITVKDWLKRDVVVRKTIFLLGFGLGMTDTSVSDFLTKVLKEDDYNFHDIEEVVYWYCAHTQQPYSKAEAIFAKLDARSNGKTADAYNTKLIQSMQSHPEAYLNDEGNLMMYLYWLQDIKVGDSKKTRAREIFTEIYEDVREMVASGYWEAWEDGKTKAGASEVTTATLESILYSGVPRNSSGNMEKMTMSNLSDLFMKKRLHRLKMNQILEGKVSVERFDLITILFLKYALGIERDWPEERYIQFVDEINEILHELDMSDIYPVNPYEAFVLMCVVTDDPLDAYSQVWEMSYDVE